MPLDSGFAHPSTSFSPVVRLGPEAVQAQSFPLGSLSLCSFRVCCVVLMCCAAYTGLG